jgi:hypothetical protein
MMPPQTIGPVARRVRVPALRFLHNGLCGSVGVAAHAPEPGGFARAAAGAYAPSREELS